jgi:hypothetical protein
MLKESGKRSVLRKINEMTTPNRKQKTRPNSFFGRRSSKYLMSKKMIAEKTRKNPNCSESSDIHWLNWAPFSLICFAGSTTIKNSFLLIVSKYFSFGKSEICPLEREEWGN